MDDMCHLSSLVPSARESMHGFASSPNNNQKVQEVSDHVVQTVSTMGSWDRKHKGHRTGAQP